jgi:hypothetical protein
MGRITPQLTSLKTLNITYQTPQETLLGTPETLPTSEPGTPQISYTVADGNLPAFNMGVYAKKWIAYIIGAGQFVTAGSVYWRIKKNGASVATGNSLISSYAYYTVNCYFYDVAVGDVLELALWSTVADSNWLYKAYQIQLTRLILMNKPRILVPCNFTALSTQPVLTLGVPSFSTYNPYVYHLDVFFVQITVATNFENLQPKTYGIFRTPYGDISNSNTAVVRTSASYRPYYYRNNIPTQIVLRGVKVD